MRVISGCTRSRAGKAVSSPAIHSAVLCLLLAAAVIGAALGGGRLPTADGEVRPATTPGALTATAAGSPSAEPGLPLRLSWHCPPAGDAASPRSARLTIHADEELPAMRVDVHLPEGVCLLSGETSFRGGLRRGGEKALALSVLVADGGPRVIQARAVAVTAGGISFRRGAALVIEPSDGGSDADEAGVLRSDADGRRTVREYRAKEAR